VARRPSGCLGPIALVFLIGAFAVWSLNAGIAMLILVIICAVFVRSTRGR
jgi:hypothetical protein